MRALGEGRHEDLLHSTEHVQITLVERPTVDGPDVAECGPVDGREEQDAMLPPLPLNRDST